MEKFYYTINDIKEFFYTCGIFWDGNKFSYKNGNKNIELPKVEDFIKAPSNANFYHFDDRSYVELDVGRIINAQMFINNYNFILTCKELDCYENKVDLKSKHFNYACINNEGKVDKVNRLYCIEYDFPETFYKGSYEDLSELWVNYLARKHPQTYFQSIEKTENININGLKALEDLKKICKKTVEYKTNYLIRNRIPRIKVEAKQEEKNQTDEMTM